MRTVTISFDIEENLLALVDSPEAAAAKAKEAFVLYLLRVARARRLNYSASRGKR